MPGNLGYQLPHDNFQCWDTSTFTSSVFLHYPRNRRVGMDVARPFVFPKLGVVKNASHHNWDTGKK